MSEGLPLRLQPTAVALPADGRWSRTFYDKRQHLPGKPPLTEADYANFDRHALFHDVYLATDGRAIEAIGPPLVNLASDVLPLALSLPGHDERRLPHRMRHYHRVTVHRFELPKVLHDSPAIELRVAFAHGQVEELVAYQRLLPPVTLQVTTMQKNNAVRWIVDWLDWLGLIGVERVLLYDNGSDEADALFDALSSGHASRPAVVFIDWPYPFGPPSSHYNYFAQASQNNHAHRCLGGATWTGHFDVDEYPLVDSGGQLPGSLRRRVDAARARTGLLRLDSYWMPDVRDKASDALPTVRDFAYREHDPRGHAHKYLVRNRALRMATTHNARLRFGWAWRTTATSDACFLHYRPLTTRWRLHATSLGERETFDPAIHVAERTVIEAFEGAECGFTTRSAVV